MTAPHPIPPPIPGEPGEDLAGRGTHLFFVLCAALVAGFIAWAWFGRLDVVSAAAGEVVPATEVKRVQHLEGGIVRTILAGEGDAVTAGQPLVELEPVRSDADLQELTVRIDSLRADVARLEAEATGDAPLVFPPELVAAAPERVAEATDLHAARQARHQGRLERARARIAERRRMVEGIETALTNARTRRALLREQAEISERLLKRDLTNRLLHIDVLKDLAEVEGRIAEEAVALERARAALIGAEVDLRTIGQDRLAEVREDLEEKRRELSEFVKRRSKLDDSLARTVLRAPVDGVVKTLHVVAPGEVVRPGATVADVVPGGDTLVVQARLPVQEIGHVHPGQGAKIRLASADGIRFGAIEGRVVRVSPDAIEDADGPAYYEVRIETAADSFRRAGVEYRLVPGVQVSCSILTGQRSVLEYLIDPFLQGLRLALSER